VPVPNTLIGGNGNGLQRSCTRSTAKGYSAVDVNVTDKQRLRFRLMGYTVLISPSTANTERSREAESQALFVSDVYIDGACILSLVERVQLRCKPVTVTSDQGVGDWHIFRIPIPSGLRRVR